MNTNCPLKKQYTKEKERYHDILLEVFCKLLKGISTLSCKRLHCVIYIQVNFLSFQRHPVHRIFAILVFPSRSNFRAARRRMQPNARSYPAASGLYIKLRFYASVIVKIKSRKPSYKSGDSLPLHPSARKMLKLFLGWALSSDT